MLHWLIQQRCLVSQLNAHPTPLFLHMTISVLMSAQKIPIIILTTEHVMIHVLGYIIRMIAQEDVYKFVQQIRTYLGTTINVSLNVLLIGIRITIPELVCNPVKIVVLDI